MNTKQEIIDALNKAIVEIQNDNLDLIAMEWEVLDLLHGYVGTLKQRSPRQMNIKIVLMEKML